ncbi:MAG: sulfurtransferase TusA family protein [Pseudomonadales bacterium]|jgi:TusA-related sulfurtransferase|nr:sulfurtransferase TusA family protein [Pseudomonadales bacterium]
MMFHADQELDLCGLNCPMPLLKTKQALNRMESGKVILVKATDPGSERDFQVFAAQSGTALLRMEHSDGTFCYWLRKP